MSVTLYPYLINEEALKNSLNQLRAGMPTPEPITCIEEHKVIAYLDKSDFNIMPHTDMGSLCRVELIEWIDQVSSEILLTESYSAKTEISIRALSLFTAHFLMGRGDFTDANDYGSADEIYGSLYSPCSCHRLLQYYERIDPSVLEKPSKGITHTIFDRDEVEEEFYHGYELQIIQSPTDMYKIITVLANRCREAVSNKQALYVTV